MMTLRARKTLLFEFVSKAESATLPSGEARFEPYRPVGRKLQRLGRIGFADAKCHFIDNLDLRLRLFFPRPHSEYLH